MIKDAAFRERLFAFLDRNVYQGFLDKEDFGIPNDTAPPRPDAPNDERLCGCDRHAARARKGTGIKTHVLSQRPPNPDGPDFLHLWIDRCNSLAAKPQRHKCYGDPAERTGCWTITDKDNNPVCKSGFDQDGNKPLVFATNITAEGELELRRSHPKINNFNPAMIAVLRCNMVLLAFRSPSALTF
jgi:hypothetical protein